MILLDTCALLWLAADRAAFSSKAMAHLNNHFGALAISPISFHEVGIKPSQKRLRLSMSLSNWSASMVAKYALTVLPVTTDIAVTAATLPPIHSDPFDRIIIATAQVNKMVIITADEKFFEYPNVKVIW
jgi:PIN domain nuclease of toxin-antitoxin system